MSRLESLQESSLYVYPLSSSVSRQALCLLSQLISSCSGPNGRNHIVQNTCGGHMTITSTCSRLLSSISVSRSELKLVVSAVMGHLQQREDCGLFMAHLCLQLTKSTLDVNIHHSIVSSTFQSFVSIIVDYIKCNNCEVSVKADFSNVNILVSYVKSIFTSKSLLNITPQELNSFSLIVLDTFVQVIPSVPVQRYSSGVYVLGVEKQPLSRCKSMDGILIEFPELPVHGNSLELILKKEMAVDVCGQSELYIKTALITCSMSGDMIDILKTTFEATEQEFVDMEECAIEKLEMFCKVLEIENVGIVLCQRVIHPRIKALLRSKNIIFVDRLGSQPIPFIKDLTGCQPITSILQDIQRIGRSLGKLTSVKHIIENGKSYISLQNNSVNVITLIVCGEFEERLSELKSCVSTCLQGLGALVKEPWLLMGGGCWQMHCSQFLKEKVLSTLPEMSKRLYCSESTIRQLLTIFRSCLHQWCLCLKNNVEHLSLDQSSGHCWRVSKNIPVDNAMNPCACGFKTMSTVNLQDLDIVLTHDGCCEINEAKNSSQNAVKIAEECDSVVLDSLTACIEALHKGVLTAGLLLSIGQFISDKN